MIQGLFSRAADPPGSTFSPPGNPTLILLPISLLFFLLSYCLPLLFLCGSITPRTCRDGKYKQILMHRIFPFLASQSFRWIEAWKEERACVKEAIGHWGCWHPSSSAPLTRSPAPYTCSGECWKCTKHLLLCIFLPWTLTFIITSRKCTTYLKAFFIYHHQLWMDSFTVLCISEKEKCGGEKRLRSGWRSMKTYSPGKSPFHPPGSQGRTCCWWSCLGRHCGKRCPRAQEHSDTAEGKDTCLLNARVNMEEGYTQWSCKFLCHSLFSLPPPIV